MKFPYNWQVVFKDHSSGIMINYNHEFYAYMNDMFGIT